MEALEIAGIAWRLPKRLDELVTRVDEGGIQVASPRLERRVARLERVGKRLVGAVLFGALLIAGAIIHAGDAVFGTVLMAASVLPLLYTLAGGRRG